MAWTLTPGLQARGVTEPSRVAQMLQDAREAAQFLDVFVVQGVCRCASPRAVRRLQSCAGERTAEGNFAVKLEPQHAGKQVQTPAESAEDDGCCSREGERTPK
jgi:hypothetical protein